MSDQASTIVALSTAKGSSAIAVVRLSGPCALEIGKKIFVAATRSSNVPPLVYPSQAPPKSNFTSQKAVHGFVYDPHSGLPIDEVVLIPYFKPNSYTGEDLLEISCHGSPIITNSIVSLCMSLGCRLASPGEFTQRAFLSGRIDLTQAEGVLDLIQAKTGKQSHMALSALTGHLGHEITAIRTRLLELLTQIVAGIDFPEEVGDMPSADVNSMVKDCLLKLQALAERALSFKFVKEGLKIAIVGKPNAGKSSLLNQLLKFERAIVTEIPGTTRDSLEELLDIKGIPVTLIDTAGIRHTEDKVEKIGIERTKRAIDACHLVLFVSDLTTRFEPSDELILQEIGEKPYLLLANKNDLRPDTKGGIMPPPHSNCLARISISAKTGAGIDSLSNEIERFSLGNGETKEPGASLNARQSELCTRAIKSLNLVLGAANSGLPQDCLATDLKAAIDNLSEISGESVSDEVIGQVFANFCIGK